MTTTAAGEKAGKPKKRTPQRLTAEKLKDRITERMKKDDYKGPDVANVMFETMEYDENLRRQFVTIKTVDEDGKLDGNTRRVATSDLQHVRHTEEVSEAMKRKRNNAKRAAKRKQEKK